MGRVIVVGAGVVGLTCAVRLLEAGHRVDVVARDLPLETTSVVAAALWSPYVAEQAHVLRWSRRAYDVYAGLAADDGTGVALREGRRSSARSPRRPGGTRHCHRASVPTGRPGCRPASPRAGR